MKQIIVAAAVLLCSMTSFATDPGVSEKVLEAFNKTFTDAKEVSWSQSAYSYEVSFKQNAIQVRVNYDKEGNILNTLRYYSEEQLPLIVLSKLKTKYSDKKIFGVTEIASQEGTFFHVVLEDAKHWMEVKADIFGGLTVMKKMKKG
jgi:hypothetical protein